jgi:CRP-like cAMP-binding protein
LVKQLGTVALFANLSKRQLGRVASRGWERTFPAGRVLCQQDRGADDFFVILDGTAEASRGSKRVRTLRAGDYFGEIALLDNAQRTATVVATTPLRCFLLGRSEFKSLIYEEDIAVKLLFTMAQRLRAAERLTAD